MTNATHPYDALMNITARPPTVFVRATAPICGTTAASAISTSCRAGRSIASAIRPPIVADALAAQAKLLLTPSPAFFNGPSLKLAQGAGRQQLLRPGVLCQFRRRSQ